MAGYSRQSAASIVPTAVVRATPLNDEFNTLRDAFVVATGHKHDGTSTEGAYVPLISDTNSRNKVVVDSANNRISLFINVSSAAVEQLRLIDGAILPVTDNDIDLGSSSFEFKDLFIDGTANIDSLVADTAAISGGTINSAVIGGTTPAAGTFTTVSATVSATIPSATISGGTINNTTIGATTPAAGTFTNLTVNTAATIASAAISAGTINNTVIGGTTPQAVTGTTITANTGFVGALTGNVTGNVTASSGTSTFNNATVNGTLSATLTGNVNASSGTSTFNNVTISGTLNMDGATAATITNLSSPVNNSDAATKLYVDTSISNLVNSAPGTLDTLNELATALGNDPSFATTVTNSIATKLSLSGGTMTGAIAMGTNKITGMGDPTNAQDAATKTYVDTQRDTRLALSGGTMSGAIAMGTNKITGLGDPTANQDAATKIYVDGILGSATSAAASAAAAATSASNAATSASNASTSATNAASSASAAAASAAAAAASYDSFDDRYLGVKTSDPSLDNDGNALVTGAIYFNSTAGEMRVWTGSAWASTLLTTGAQTFTGVKTFASNPILDAGTANGVAYLNGSKVLTTGSALTFDGTNSYLGIGPGVTPTKSLTIYNPSIDTEIRLQTGTKNFYLSQRNSSGQVDYIVADNAAQTWSVNNAEQMRLTSTGLGIGTSNPQSKLHIQSTVGTAETLINLQTAWNSPSGNKTIRWFDGSGALGAIAVNYTAPQAAMTFGSLYNSGYNTTDLMTLTPTGLGIGTSSPGTKLDVRGSVTSQADSAYYRIRRASSADVGYVTDSGTWGDSGADFAIGASSSNLRFYTNNSATERMRLDSSGNLGLGVTPSGYLANKFVINTGTDSNNGITIASAANRNGSIWFADGTTGDQAYRGGVDYQHTTDTLYLYSGGQGNFQLTAAGNIGLGVTPSAWGTSGNILRAFEGFGGSFVASQSGLAASFVGTACYYDGSSWRYKATGTVPSYAQQYQGIHSWYTAPSGTAGNAISFTQAMTLDASGNLRLGTTSSLSAADRLTVVGGNIAVQRTSGITTFMGDNTQDGYAGTVTNHAFALLTNSTERARITSGGNVGIGTSSPTDTNGFGRALDLNGPDGAAYYARAGGSGTNFTLFGNYGADGYILNRGAGNLYFFNNNAERARITSGGLFGLGVTSPQAMFDLAGDYKEGVVTANTGTAYTINTANGTLQILTLTGNCTFTFPTAIAGESFTLLLRQDGTGGRTVTWPAAVRWPGNTAPTITSTASQTDKYIFTADGTRWYGSNAGQAYVA